MNPYRLIRFVCLCSLLFLGACSHAQKIYNNKSNQSTLTMYAMQSPGCDYVKVSRALKKTRQYDLYVEFGCHPGMPLYIRKSTYDAKGRYVDTWHTVSATGDTLKMMGMPLIPSLQNSGVKASFVGISEEDRSLLKMVSGQLSRIGYKHRLDTLAIDQLAGWINASKGL